MSEAFVFDAVRTPRGRGKKDGSLHSIRPIDLAKTVLDAIRERNSLDTTHVVDVILGCVTAIGDQGGNIAKAATMHAGFSENVGGLTINRFCGSGLEAVNQAAARVSSGMEDLFVAGGVEAMSRLPIGADGGPWSVDPQVATETYFVPQGISADLIATRKGFSRDDVDLFAVESQVRATKAANERWFAKSLIPVRDINGEVVLDHDEHIRPETTLATLDNLNPSFAKMGREAGFNSVALQKYPEVEAIKHVHHAGNSSGIVDGAAAVLIGSKNYGDKLGLKARARIKAHAVVSTDPTLMLTGPVPATQLALKKANMTVNDIDLFEVNEAFAAVVLNFMQELDVAHDKVNVNGGAIALGHPLGATGAMLLGTVLDELERQDKNTGLITLCIGGGMGIATIIERV